MKSREAFFRKLAVMSMAVLVAGFGLFYRYRYNQWLSNLPGYDIVEDPDYQERPFPLLNQKQTLMLGWGLRPEPSNEFLKDHLGMFSRKAAESWYGAFPRQKEPGTIRIGIFGCSFVAGDEVSEQYDFPTLLQKNFDEAGYSNIEVINFGVGGYGVHQSYLLWKYLGKHYQLDYVIFNPYSWHYRRDRSFIYRDYYFPPHARFIVEHNELKLVPVIGETRLEATRIFRRLFPPWQYFRYDSRTPNFLKLFVPVESRLEANPFYYRKDRSVRQDVLETYQYIFKELSQQVKNLIVVCNNKKILEFKNKVKAPNLFFFESKLLGYIGLNQSIYYAPHGHMSPLGNQLRADEIFNLLTGENNDLKIVEFGLLPIEKTSAHKISAPLFEQQNVSFKMLDKNISSFALFKQREKVFFRLEKNGGFKEKKIASLLHFPQDLSLLKFIPLKFMLSNEEKVFISFKLDDRLVRVPVGVVESAAGMIGKVRVDQRRERKVFVFKGPDWIIKIRRKQFWNKGRIFSDRTIREIKLLIGDREISSGKLKAISNDAPINHPQWDGVAYSFPEKNFVVLKTSGTEYLDIRKTTATKGTLDFAVYSNNQEIRYPFCAWMIVKKPFDDALGIPFIVP